MSFRVWARRAGVTVAVAAIAPAGLLMRTAGAWASTGHRATCSTSSADRDGDKIPDCWESANGLKVGTRDGKTDKDHDGLKAATEYTLDRRTTSNGLFAPFNASLDDTDGNGV